MKTSGRAVRDLAPILLMAATAPFLLFAVAGLDSNTEDVRQWLPKSVPERQTYDRFIEQFGVDDVVLASWPGCTLEDQRLMRLAEVLSAPAEHGLPTGLIRRVWTGPNLMRRLMSPPLDLSGKEALDRLSGLFVGDDGSTTCLLAETSAQGRRNRKTVIKTVRRAAEIAGVEAQSLRLGGNVAMGVAIDEETMRTFHTLIAPSAAVALVLAGFCLRSVRLIVIVVVAGAFSQLLALGMVRFAGGQLNSILTAMPSLILVLTVSGAIHLITYYRDAVASGGVEGSAGRALRAGWGPCALAAVTTAVGMASLSVCEIDTIRGFGLYSAAGLLGSLAIQLTFVPAALDLWPPSASEIARGHSGFLRGQPVGALGWIARIVLDRPNSWVIGWAVLTLLAAVGLHELRTSLRVDKFFRESSRIMRDFRWLEQNIGPLEQVELILRFHEPDPQELVDRMRFASAVHRNLKKIPEVQAVYSPATFLPSLPRGRSIRDVIAREVAAAQIGSRREMFLERGMMILEEGDELWRVTVRVSALEGVDYPRLVQQVRKRVDHLLDERPEPGVAPVRATCTGLWPLFYQGQRMLVNDLRRSFVAALLMITPMLILAFRSLGAGLLAMIPNITPVVVVYGTVGWLGIPIDIGIVVAASVAIGIAVDGTLHFVSRYRRVRDRGASDREAIFSAFGHCATAMTQTTVICGLSLLVFVASMFLPTARFAWLLFFTLLVALAADLALLPALLASRLGRWF